MTIAATPAPRRTVDAQGVVWAVVCLLARRPAPHAGAPRARRRRTRPLVAVDRAGRPAIPSRTSSILVRPPGAAVQSP